MGKEGEDGKVEEGDGEAPPKGGWVWLGAWVVGRWTRCWRWIGVR